MELEHLYNLAEKENIEIYKLNLKDIQGVYLCEGSNYYIALSEKIKNNQTELTVLAEELGHHFAGVLPNIPYANDYYNILVRSKNEFKALKWSVGKLIPFSELKSFIRQNKPNYACEIAEEFGITEELVKKALELYMKI